MAESADDERLANLAHDLQNLLAVAHGHAQLIHRRLERDGTIDLEPTKRRLRIIHTSTWRMATIIATLQDGTWRHLAKGDPSQVTPSADDD